MRVLARDGLRVPALLAAVLLLTLAVAWLTPAPASACSCMPASDAEFAQRADVIFTGSVADDGQGPTRTLTFTVDRVYKGGARVTQIVSTEGSTASCGLSVDGPGPYLIFARQQGSGLTAGLCEGSRAGPAPASLGPGQPPRADPTRPDPGPRAGFWIPVVGLVLAASAAGLVGWTLLRRRPG